MTCIGIDFDLTMIDEQGKAIEGLIIYMSKLRDAGYTFHIITAREDTFNNRLDITRVKTILDNKFDIPITGITFTDGDLKGKYAFLNACSHMIDDNPEYLSNCKKYGVIPIVFQTWKQVYEDIIG